jgi:hypothetical protein
MPRIHLRAQFRDPATAHLSSTRVAEQHSAHARARGVLYPLRSAATSPLARSPKRRSHPFFLRRPLRLLFLQHRLTFFPSTLHVLQMSHWSEAENYRTAAIFAHRILALDPIAAKITPQIETHARAAILQADVSPQDALPTAYDPFTPFQLCASTLTPIYAGSGEAVVKGRYSGASYKEEFKGEVCRVDEISLIGGRGCGLRSRI